jgi:tubulin polyglutamylase TTLL1
VVPAEVYSPDIISNHLPRNYCIGSKKNLFKSLSQYLTRRKKNPFDFIPRTYHIKSTDCP